MSSNVDEEVQRLCREIPEEKDSEKMMKLVGQLNRLLDEKEAGKPNLQVEPILIKNDEEQGAQGLRAGEVGSEKRKSA